MIEITSEVGDKKSVYRFKPMTPGETALWAAKMKSRLSFIEALGRELVLMEREPIATRDPDKYITLSDRMANLQNDLLKVSVALSDYCVEPSPDVVRKMLDQIATAGEVTDVLMKYLAALMPSPEEQKKS